MEKFWNFEGFHSYLCSLDVTNIFSVINAKILH